MSELHKKLSRIEFEMREKLHDPHPDRKRNAFLRGCQARRHGRRKNAFHTAWRGGFGVLSTDRLRNLKYHLVITVSFITRFCVEGGMERETAYNLSDLYIRKADLASSPEEIKRDTLRTYHGFHRANGEAEKRQQLLLSGHEMHGVRLRSPA